MERIKLSKANPQVKKILDKTYPDYTGRKISLRASEKYYMSDYWSGGSRSYVVAVNMITGEIAAPTHNAKLPWCDEANAVYQIPENVMLVEHCIFCGKDIGIVE